MNVIIDDGTNIYTEEKEKAIRASIEKLNIQYNNPNQKDRLEALESAMLTLLGGNL